MAENIGTFLQRFSESIASFPEIVPGCGILLSLSAGKDSMALFHLLNSLKTEKNFRIGVFHLNHCIRDKESDDDEQFLADICKVHGIPFFPFKHHFTDTVSFEEKAREKRYELSESLRAAEGYDFIATAHTKNDTVETVLMRLFTGTHIRGLEGIPAQRGKIIRPLLYASSAEVYSYLNENNFAWREDLSNADDSYARNFIRHRVVPLVETKFPRALSTIAECSAAAIDNRRLIETLLNNAGIEWYQHDSVTGIKYHQLLNDEYVFNYITAELLRRAGQFVSGEKISEMRKKFSSAKNRIVLYDSPECEIIKDLRPGYMSVYAVRKQADSMEKLLHGAPDDVWSATITINGDIADLHVLHAPFPLKAQLLENNHQTENFDSSDVLFLDVSCVTQVNIRSVCPGDAIVSGGVTRKLKNLMIDNKCSPEEKRSVPVILSGNDIAAAGFGMIKRGKTRIADSFRVAPASKKVLALHRLYPEK